LKDLIWLVFVVAIIASGGPAIFIGAVMVGAVAWWVFWR